VSNEQQFHEYLLLNIGAFCALLCSVLLLARLHGARASPQWKLKGIELVYTELV
jgi:hypothetical protein